MRTRRLTRRLVLIAISSYLVTGCGGNAVPTTSEPAPPATTVTTTVASDTTSSAPEPSTTVGESSSSAQAVNDLGEVAGAFRSVPGEGFGFLQIGDDGAVTWAPDDASPSITFAVESDGATHRLTDPDCGDDIQGEYEFHLHANGDLEVVLIADSCPGRASLIPGVYAPTG